MQVIREAGGQACPGVAAICSGGLRVDDHAFLGQRDHPARHGDCLVAGHAIQVTDLAGRHVDRLPVAEVNVAHLCHGRGRDREAVTGWIGEGLSPTGFEHFTDCELCWNKGGELVVGVILLEGPVPVVTGRQENIDRFAGKSGAVDVNIPFSKAWVTVIFDTVGIHVLELDPPKQQRGRCSLP